jgi:uncharacterized membrane protein
MKISAEELAAREYDMMRARKSTELEGGRSSEAARAIQDRYVRGEITSDEMVRLTKELFGAPVG